MTENETRKVNVKDFKVGQTVWVELIGNASIGKTKKQCIKECEVTYIGKEYIKAVQKGRNANTAIKFCLDEYSGKFISWLRRNVTHILYETKQEINEKFERQILLSNINSMLCCGMENDITLKQLRQIYSILCKKSDDGM